MKRIPHQVKIPLICWTLYVIIVASMILLLFILPYTGAKLTETQVVIWGVGDLVLCCLFYYYSSIPY